MAIGNLPLTLLLVAFPEWSLGQSGSATLYDDVNYGGATQSVSVGNCANVFNFNDRTSSVRTNVCLRLYEHSDCTGRRIEVQPDGNPNLVQLNFNDLTTSVSDCRLGTSSDVVRVIVDTSDAPDLRDFGERVKRVIQDWFPFIQGVLSTPSYVPPDKITVYFDPKDNGVAGTDAWGNHITGGANYYRHHQDDIGSMIHELTHLVQKGLSPCPGYIYEGYAEWIRRFFYEPNTGAKRPVQGDNWDDGGRMAWLLDYINSKQGTKPMIYYLNKACQMGTWYDGIWKDLSGKSLQELWNEMINDPDFPWKKNF